MKSAINKATIWWSTLSLRERQLMIVFSVMIALAILYWGMYKPLDNRVEQAQINMEIEKELHSWVVGSANRISTYRTVSPRQTNNQSISQMVSTQASKLQVNIIRTQPKGNQLQVWVQAIPFETLVRWLVELKKQGVYVSSLDIDRSNISGVVEVKQIQFAKY